MLTLYHAPQSRSFRVLNLIEELEAPVEIRTVSIPRRDGSGGRDPANPHPEGKVPLLVHDGAVIRETPAILLYLTDLFPEAGLGPLIGDPNRGPYLSWLSYYAGVAEPVVIFHHVLHLDDPLLHATFRGVEELTARLAEALEKGPWLLGDRFTAADLLLSSPFAWFPAATPDHPRIRDWVARCEARPANQRAKRRDAALAAA